MLVYLAGPCRQAGMVNANGWRQDVAKAAGQLGIICFNPAAAWNPSTNMVRTEAEHEMRLEVVNNAALAVSDLVVVAFQPTWSERSNGTDLELILSQSMRKMVVVYLPQLPATSQHEDEFERWLGDRFALPTPSICHTLNELVMFMYGLSAARSTPFPTQGAFAPINSGSKEVRS